MELAEKRGRSVTTAVIILLQQDIDLHELPLHGENLKKAAGCQRKTAPREIPLSRCIESHPDNASFMRLSSTPLFVDAK